MLEEVVRSREYIIVSEDGEKRETSLFIVCCGLTLREWGAFFFALLVYFSTVKEQDKSKAYLEEDSMARVGWLTGRTRRCYYLIPVYQQGFCPRAVRWSFAATRSDRKQKIVAFLPRRLYNGTPLSACPGGTYTLPACQRNVLSSAATVACLRREGHVPEL